MDNRKDGRDPAGQALVASDGAASVSTLAGFDPSRIWLTNEMPPRRLIIRGTAAIDPDVWVAEFEDGSEGYRGKALWIVKSSGFVCGIHSVFEPAKAVYASPVDKVA